MLDADPRIVSALAALPPGSALDLACGSGRHAIWLAQRGWRVTAVDKPGHPNFQPESYSTHITYITADLEQHGFAISPATYDLIVCWLYWQPDLLLQIAEGVRGCGQIALAGKTSGRFATSLANYRAAFAGWLEIDAGETGTGSWFIARRC